MKILNHEARMPTTPEERRATKKARKEQRARIRLIIETYEWLIHRYADAGRLEKCQEMAAKMMARAKENPENFGRWKRVIVRVS